MIYNLITAASSLPVSLADTKTHLRITHSDHDDMVTDLIWGAVREFENKSNECLSAQTWDLVLDESEVTSVIKFHKYPVLGITSISYYDSDNTAQSLTHSNGDYFSFVNGRPAFIDFSADETPSTYDRGDALTIRIYCGYSTLPYDIKQAILSRVYRLYENPNDPVSEKQTYFDRVLRDYRSYDL